MKNTPPDGHQPAADSSNLRPGELILWAFIARKLAEIEAKYPGTRNHAEEIRAAIYGITCGW